MGSILFFVGILLAVATLEHTGVLVSLAGWLDRTVGRQDLIVLIIGIASAIVDNVPLVAASMGMYSLSTYPSRPLPVDVPRLLRRHRRFHPDHRLSRRCGGHGCWSEFDSAGTCATSVLWRYSGTWRARAPFSCCTS